MSESKIVQLAGREPAPLSNADLERLLKVARLREKIAKAAVAEHRAQLMAPGLNIACQHLFLRHQRDVEESF